MLCLKFWLNGRTGDYMRYNKVEICGVNTAKLPILSEKEKTELLIKTKQGSSAARDKLIGGNLRLVLSVIQRFSNRCDDLDDLFQIGCIGLIKAIDNFDISQDVRFSTYAVPMSVYKRNGYRERLLRVALKFTVLL